MNKVRLCFVHCRQFYTIKTPTKSFTSLKNLLPEKPYAFRINPQNLTPKTRIDADTISLLERLSLVDCANKKGIETLEAAIEFADQIQQVDTTGIEPLVTILEDLSLRLREDEVNDGDCRVDILQNAYLTEEDYFVAPPGNIALEARNDLLFEQESEYLKKKHS